jgi:hypothetical protein
LNVEPGAKLREVARLISGLEIVFGSSVSR